MAWTMIKKGQDHGVNSAYMELMIDSPSDINNEPTEYGPIAPGSVAYTCEPGGTALDQLFMKAADGTWVEM